MHIVELCTHGAAAQRLGQAQTVTVNRSRVGIVTAAEILELPNGGQLLDAGTLLVESLLQ